MGHLIPHKTNNISYAMSVILYKIIYQLSDCSSSMYDLVDCPNKHIERKAWLYLQRKKTLLTPRMSEQNIISEQNIKRE